ncbi:hypothetical protein L1987_46449 [Smallanthus sonchifolius]|uniref:Uncharacterized protein n=1 Tax=Smallanthus sonchifolius TaxID=185202 RepID=A0ACB9FZT2_9ASTR|nr:hypothetical protein L1987_46449 [Smallanthus sonchifolius]
MAKIVETHAAQTPAPCAFSCSKDPSYITSNNEIQLMQHTYPSNLARDHNKLVLEENHVVKKIHDEMKKNEMAYKVKLDATLIENQALKEFKWKLSSDIHLHCLDDQRFSFLKDRIGYKAKKFPPPTDFHIGLRNEVDEDARRSFDFGLKKGSGFCHNIDISQCFPYKVHKTTMDPVFLVINEWNDDMRPRGVYLDKKTTKNKSRPEKIKQEKL